MGFPKRVCLRSLEHSQNPFIQAGCSVSPELGDLAVWLAFGVRCKVSEASFGRSTRVSIRESGNISLLGTLA